MTSPYFTTERLAIALEFLDSAGAPDIQRALKFIYRQKLTVRRVGKSVRVRIEDVEQAIGEKPGELVRWNIAFEKGRAA